MITALQCASMHSGLSEETIKQEFSWVLAALNEFSSRSVLDHASQFSSSQPCEGREVYESFAFADIKWELGRIFQSKIQVTETGNVEGNPMIHAMAEYVSKLLSRTTLPVQGESHLEIIKCTECGFIQPAKVLHTIPFGTFIHECKNCKYTIMESEWEKYNPNTIAEEKDGECEHYYVPVGEYDQNGDFICIHCKSKK